MMVLFRRSALAIVASVVVLAMVTRSKRPSLTRAPEPLSPPRWVVRDLPDTTPLDAPGRPWLDAERCPDGYTLVASEAHWSNGRCQVGPLTFEQTSNYGASRWSAGAFECGIASPGVPEQFGARFEHRAHRDLGVHEYRCVRRGDGSTERYRRVRVQPR
jgi:hypothetical protein